MADQFGHRLTQIIRHTPRPTKLGSHSTDTLGLAAGGLAPARVEDAALLASVLA